MMKLDYFFKLSSAATLTLFCLFDKETVYKAQRIWNIMRCIEKKNLIYWTKLQMEVNVQFFGGYGSMVAKDLHASECFFAAVVIALAAVLAIALG